MVSLPDLFVKFALKYDILVQIVGIIQTTGEGYPPIFSQEIKIRILLQIKCRWIIGGDLHFLGVIRINKEIKDRMGISVLTNGEGSKEMIIRIRIGISMQITIIHVPIVEYQGIDKDQRVSYGVNTEMREEFQLFRSMIDQTEIRIKIGRAHV